MKILMMTFSPFQSSPGCKAINPAIAASMAVRRSELSRVPGLLCFPTTPPIELSAADLGLVSVAYEGQRIRCSSFCQMMSRPPSTCLRCQRSSLLGPGALPTPSSVFRIYHIRCVLRALKRPEMGATRGVLCRDVRPAANSIAVKSVILTYGWG